MCCVRLFHVLMSCEIPHIAYRAPGETECGQPHGKAQACQPLKPGIGSNIVRLARVPQRHADGRIQDEMRQGYVACGFMQVPGTAQFGTDNLSLSMFASSLSSNTAAA